MTHRLPRSVENTDSIVPCVQRFATAVSLVGLICSQSIFVGYPRVAIDLAGFRFFPCPRACGERRRSVSCRRNENGDEDQRSEDQEREFNVTQVEFIHRDFLREDKRRHKFYTKSAVGVTGICILSL